MNNSSLSERADAEMPLLEISKITKYFGFPALSNVDIQIQEGDRFGLIGPNGSGKTTLMNIITGLLAADGGKILFKSEDISSLPAYKRARMGIARTFQVPKPFNSLSVVDNLSVPLRNANQAKEKVDSLEILRLLRIDSKAEAKPGELTQIELRKLELARALVQNPTLLLLDEAMAGLTGVEIDEMLKILENLSEQGISILMIEHIMKAVMSFSRKIVVLNAGMKIAEGRPEEILNNKEVERAYLGE